MGGYMGGMERKRDRSREVGTLGPRKGGAEGGENIWCRDTVWIGRSSGRIHLGQRLRKESRLTPVLLISEYL